MRGTSRRPTPACISADHATVDRHALWYVEGLNTRASADHTNIDPYGKRRLSPGGRPKGTPITTASPGHARSANERPWDRVLNQSRAATSAYPSVNGKMAVPISTNPLPCRRHSDGGFCRISAQFTGEYRPRPEAGARHRPQAPCSGTRARPRHPGHASLLHSFLRRLGPALPYQFLGQAHACWYTPESLLKVSLDSRPGLKNLALAYLARDHLLSGHQIQGATQGRGNDKPSVSAHLHIGP